MWILRKKRFWKCEFLDKLRIFAPVCPEKNLARFARFVFVVIVVWHVSFFIDTLCSHFANGKAHGNLCRQFCVTRALQPESCQTFHVGKEVVFSATMEESQKVSHAVHLEQNRFRISGFSHFPRFYCLV